MSDRVLVTGISGFLGGHVALELLEAGFEVRGSVRSEQKAQKVRETLARHGADPARVEIVTLDLLDDSGWADAATGCRYVQHVASPFVTRMPEDRDALIRPAVEGTERAISAALAAEAERVVVTSSTAAMFYGHPRDRTAPFDEHDWTVPEAPDVSAYTESKYRAERRAWQRMEAAGRREDLAVVNPSAILGPLLDDDPGTSGALVLRLLKGSVPAAPKLSFPIVDVRDVAAVQVAAMTTPEAGGRRFPASAETVSIIEMSNALREAFPQYTRKLPRFTVPDWVIRLYALFDADVRGNLGELGMTKRVDAKAAATLIGREMTPALEAARATAQSLTEAGLV